ncbi:MAG: J domain-containing protein [Methylobacter sp.]|nr:J domain-containing protein [Methylobacter sp.]
MAKFKTHYDNLNVSRNAPVSVIKAAYKVLCQNYHPDKYTGRPEEALRIMKIINVAYTVLSDSGKRAEHDRWIDRQEREHATDKAQRIMTIITNTYVEPPITPPKNLSVSYLATVYEFLKKVGSVGNKVRLISIPRSKKLNLILGSIGFVGIVFTAIILYGPDLKTKTVAAASVNQDIEAILKKAKHTLNKGQVAKALSLYLQLAEQGSAEAQFQAGLIYANGQGQAKDDKQAVGWLAKAAEQGHREAQTKLGFIYATGRGVAQNYSSAVYWCYKAAEQGDVIAQYNLGLMYAKGQGVAKDNSLAVSWYSKAAGQGDAHAQYNLGDMYANGVGVTKDNKQAAVLYRKAAKQGLAEAIAALKPLDR